ncbi:hypothetical protein GCM10018952_57010 [Streptosporangium vulgare]
MPSLGGLPGSLSGLGDALASALAPLPPGRVTLVLWFVVGDRAVMDLGIVGHVACPSWSRRGGSAGFRSFPEAEKS